MTDLTMRELANIVKMNHLADWQLKMKCTCKTIFIKYCELRKVKPILDTLIIGFNHGDGTRLELQLYNYMDATYIDGILQVATWLHDMDLPDDCQVIEVDFKRKEIIK